MNKNIDLDEVPAKIELIRKYGFKVVSFFVIGYPGETVEDIRMTVDTALRLPLARAHFNCFSPLPGSPVFDELAAKGMIRDFDIRHVHFETINYSYVEGVSAKQLNRIRLKALLRFYARPRIFFGMFRTFRNWSSIRFLFAKGLEYLGLH